MHRRVSTAGAATSTSVPTARLIESWASLKSFVRKDGSDAQKVQAAKEQDAGNPMLDLRGKSVATPHAGAGQILRVCCNGRARANKPGCVLAGMC
jgi:hypothetical protein